MFQPGIGTSSLGHLVSGVLAKLRKSHNMQVPAVWLQAAHRTHTVCRPRPRVAGGTVAASDGGAPVQQATT
ncbi:hypothetical protein CHLRE_17g744047v5 [Chlamydomonas reinhardtii]|uniref:Uncharacterized protein n=1 Tax=Chlamydomonas reinhardtii TaxID=3055 RepID=A0A2K3CRY7_CHLRE|nr:uncharacterized protein CHLRE_17g744047v5 [Chlamydomonas reinhardtii]PNW71043.1 hypothetical protein CHLRE_17g744047v5 [Chlamydomonas reinhardtii]